MSEESQLSTPQLGVISPSISPQLGIVSPAISPQLGIVSPSISPQLSVVTSSPMLSTQYRYSPPANTVTSFTCFAPGYVANTGWQNYLDSLPERAAVFRRSSSNAAFNALMDTSSAGTLQVDRSEGSSQRPATPIMEQQLPSTSATNSRYSQRNRRELMGRIADTLLFASNYHRDLSNIHLLLRQLFSNAYADFEEIMNDFQRAREM